MSAIVCTIIASAAPSVVPLAVNPLPFSDVKLTGEWGAQVERNRETLMSLNMTKWACHFTTTANLTACESAAEKWQTYVKDATTKNFTHKLGFLAAGDDCKPPTLTTSAVTT